MPNLALILSLLAILGLGYCVWQIVSLNKLRKTFFSGNSAANLEDVICSLQNELKEIRENQAALENTLARLVHDFGFAVQKVGVVRFNPFNDGGGNFSFVLAILDRQNNGLVLTSMHGRQQNRIYTKKIDNGKSETQLTEEELQAVREADSKYQLSKAN